MQPGFKLSLSLAIGTLATVGMLFGCGPHSGVGHGGGAGGTGGGGMGGSGGGSGGTDGGGSGGCIGLQCQQMTCPGGGTTTLTGKVYAPNGTLPLYNAIVYVPNATPAPFTDGVSCDRCNGEVSGDPVVQTLSDATGSFTLTNVPVGSNIPLVIQLGKWRTQTTIASVPACVSTPLDAGSTSLPSKRANGDLPKMAIVTGSADPLECLLLKLGIDPSEITEPSTAASRIHLYKGANSPGGVISASTPDGTQLYGGSGTTLDAYDVVMLPCEGGQYDQSAGTANIGNYVNAGGRVFTTHYSYDWWHYAGSPFDQVAMSWSPELGDDYNDTIQAPINTSFPKGLAFSQWLVAAGVTASMPGDLAIAQGRHDVTGVNPMYSQDWVDYDFGSANGGAGVMHFTFNTPLNAPPDDMGQPQYCGRAVYSDFHVTANALVAGSPSSGWSFPSACASQPLSDQEKALAFMLFDLSSCVQSDQTPPIP
ncbi:MAG TPA: carboxypeptidase regulatory-like domain-containing protein [Polyangia bacterium]